MAQQVGMTLFRRIVLSALLAGVLTGVLMTLLQLVAVVPLILEAERFEQAAASAQSPGPSHAHADTAPQGLERTLYTGLMTLLMAIGYGLLLGACFAAMRCVGWRKGILLGIAGFIVFQLAPSLGLPPIPPGVPSAQVGPRQLWWVATVFATAAGLAAGYAAYRGKGLYWWVVAAVLLALPHAVGAPSTGNEPSLVPLAIVREFAIASLASAGFFWLVLGAMQGYLFERLSRRRV